MIHIRINLMSADKVSLILKLDSDCSNLKIIFKGDSVLVIIHYLEYTLCFY